MGFFLIVRFWLGATLTKSYTFSDTDREKKILITFSGRGKCYIQNTILFSFFFLNTQNCAWTLDSDQIKATDTTHGNILFGIESVLYISFVTNCAPTCFPPIYHPIKLHYFWSPLHQITLFLILLLLAAHHYYDYYF